MMASSSKGNLQYSTFSRIFISVLIIALCLYFSFLISDLIDGSSSGDTSKAATVATVEGIVCHNPEHPTLKYCIETDSGTKIPISLSSIILEDWIGKRVRATIQYEDDGVRFSIIKWEEIR